MAACCLVASCADNEMTSISVAEPDSLANTNYLKAFAPLKSYTTMMVGTGVDNNFFNAKGAEWRNACENFSEIQPARLFTHAAAQATIMSSLDGAASADSPIAAFLSDAYSSGTKVFASALCSHQNQDTDYLNTLIKPTVLSNDGSELTSRCIVASNSVKGEAKFQQFEFAFTSTPGVTPQLEYELEFYVRGTREGSFSLSVPGGADFRQKVNVTTEWKKVKTQVVMAKGIYNLRSVVFNIGEYIGTLYIDNFQLIEIDEYGDRSKNKLKDNANLDDAEATAAGLTKVDGSSDGITTLGVSEIGDGYDPNTYTMEKTPEEKAAILTNALDSWVSTVVSLYADSVSGWDVVAMPLSIDSLATDFYWQDYLGMTQYVARAFNAAHKAGGKNLFIADRYDKAAQLKALADDALAAGAEIDGYDLVIDCTDLDESLLTEALSLLAQTGKLIRLSSVNLPTAAEYSFVVSSYVKSVPAQQRHGISLKTMSPLWTTAKTRSLIYGAIAENLE